MPSIECAVLRGVNLTSYAVTVIFKLKLVKFFEVVKKRDGVCSEVL